MAREKPKVADSVKAWLEAEGYPLEFWCADVCKKVGLKPRVGTYLTSASCEPHRISVMGSYHPADKAPRMISSQLVINCIDTKDKPWVVLCQEESLIPYEWATRAVVTEHARMGLLTLPLSKVGTSEFDRDAVEQMKTIVLPTTDAIGFSVDVAGRSASDPSTPGYDTDSSLPPWHLVEKAALSATALADETSSMFSQLEKLKPNAFAPVVGLFIPCIVLKGHLVAARYDNERAEMICEEVGTARVHARSNKDVYLVTATAFQGFASRAAKAMEAFCKRAMDIDTIELKRVRDSVASSKL